MEHNLDLLNADGLDESISNTNGGFRFGNLRARLNRINRPVRLRRGDGENLNANGYQDVNLKNLDLSANGMNLQNLDLGADGDYSECCGADGENYSYITITPEQAKMAADVGGKLLANVKRKPKTELESNLKSACGRKPIGLFSMGKAGKKRRQKYEQCVAKFTSDAEKSKSAAAEATARGKEAEARTAEAKAAEAKTSSESSRLAAPPADKFLGMPKAVGITVVAVGGLALLVGGYFLIKKMRK
jgi:hypothetical protein